MTMVALAAHAFAHRANRRIGRAAAILCICVPCLSALAAILFSAHGYYRAKWGKWGEGALFDAWPLAVAQAAGLTGLAFLPLLHSPELGLSYNVKIAQRRVQKLTPGRSLLAPLVAIITFATLPEVFRKYSFLADSDLHVDSRMDLSDPDILGAPCSAVTGAASLSSYVDSPFYAVLLGLVFFFPLLDMSASSERKSTFAKLDAAMSQSLCFALALFVVRAAASVAPHRPVTARAHSPHLMRPFFAVGVPPLLRRGAAPEHRGGRIHARGCEVPHRKLHWAQDGGCFVRSQVSCGACRACDRAALHAQVALPDAPLGRVRPLLGRIAVGGRKHGVGPRGPHHLRQHLHGAGGGRRPIQDALWI